MVRWKMRWPCIVRRFGTVEVVVRVPLQERETLALQFYFIQFFLSILLKEKVPSKKYFLFPFSQILSVPDPQYMKSYIFSKNYKLSQPIFLKTLVIQHCTRVKLFCYVFIIYELQNYDTTSLCSSGRLAKALTWSLAGRSIDSAALLFTAFLSSMTFICRPSESWLCSVNI